MNAKTFLAFAVLVMVSGLVIVNQREARAGEVPPPLGYKVLEPIRHGNLTVFPVVTEKSYPTAEFMTLDEGLRSGDVVVTEAGNVQGLIRRRSTPAVRRDGAQVNRLVLVNNGKRPLLLLAGEIVTGGKQDRVIGKDRIVPAESDPIDLSVFCVEPGGWVATSGKFGSIGALAMVSPKVRAKAMVDKDQAKVWSEVRNSQAAMGGLVPAPAAREVAETSSYARVMQNSEVQKKVDSVAEPIRRDYESLIKQLRDRNAVGVVVAMNGQIIWADIFASTNLLEKYWPKLIRSYAAEAVMSRAKGAEVRRKDA